jgi:tetratricopeptide (TPR) repeat protein
MRKLFVSGLLSLAMLCGNAQTPKRINSGEIIASGFKLHDSGKYKEAIALYSTVPRNDTNYTLSLYEIALSYRADSAFTKALQICEASLGLPDNEYEMQVLSTYGSTLDDQGNRERALGFTIRHC